MSLYNSFREIAIEKCPKQAVMVDYVTEESPIVASLPMEPTSNGIQNVFERVIDISGADIVEFDAPLPSMDVTTELDKVELSVYAGEIEVAEDKVNQYGGLDVYLSKKLPKILRETGNRLEYSIYYNNLRASAAAFGKLVSAGGSGSTNYSMLCVKYTPGENMGLYDPNGFGQGKTFFDIQMGSGGELHKNASGIWVYDMRIKTYMGIQIANPRHISGIVNIDIANATSVAPAVTEQKIDEMIINARANAANTIIYCRPEVKAYLQMYKGYRMEMMPDARGIDRRFDTWNGIPIITSYNLKAGNEATVSL